MCSTIITIRELNLGKLSVILASSSSRRHWLLAKLGVQHQVIHPKIDEYFDPLESDWPSIVTRLAEEKARSVKEFCPQSLILGADTIVVYNGVGIGKPKSIQEARRILKDLRGQVHKVATGITLIDTRNDSFQSIHTETTVTMREYTNQEIETFLDSGAPMDKAGGYSIQDPIFQPAASVHGCYTNVIGLSLCLLGPILNQKDISVDSRVASQLCGNCAVPTN